MSATRMSSTGAHSSTWLYGPIRSIVRTARGPKRAPFRLVTPRSIGTPTSAASRSPKSGAFQSICRIGAARKVGMPA
jgi:hypothetical protein